MKVKCTVKEVKELTQKETPVARTTDVIKIKTAPLNNQSEIDIAVLKEKLKENLLKNQ